MATDKSKVKSKENIKAIQNSSLAYWAHMLTLRCNAKCPYCIVQERGKQAPQDELSSKEVLNWWNNVEHQPKQRLSLIGGEPTLYKDLIEVINNLDGYDITVTTNCVGSFFKNRKYEEFKPQPTSTLRVNTSFHPSVISPQEYIHCVMDMKEAGLFVHQAAFVDVPFATYKDAVLEVGKVIPLLPQPFIGFWSEKNGFNAPRKPEFLFPNEKYWDQKRVVAQCGRAFSNGYDFYKEVCGQEKSKTVYCPLIFLTLLISPAGFCYSCHHRLYHDIDPSCNIKNFKSEIDLGDLRCSHFGFCSSCDINRMYYGIRFDVANANNQKIDWLKEIE